MCYIEYELIENQIKTTKFIYYDNNEYTRDFIVQCIQAGKKPPDTLELSVTEHRFLQKELDKLQKIAFSQGVTSQAMLNGTTTNVLGDT